MRWRSIGLRCRKGLDVGLTVSYLMGMETTRLSIMETTRLSSKGQVILPKAVRDLPRGPPSGAAVYTNSIKSINIVKKE